MSDVSFGLGCMGMSGMYGPADRSESIATIHAALDAGMTLLDTGDFYGMGDNEMLLGEALRGVPRERFRLSVKFGALRGPDGSWIGYDARPVAVKSALAYSLKRLGVDHIDIYRPARLDRAVPIEETVGAIADMVKAGYVREIGLSEVGATTIRRAAATHPICDLQIEYSLLARGVETAILPVLAELDIGMTAYGVLARGLIGGHMQAGPAAPGDWRVHSPRFQAGNVEKNLALAETLRGLAEARGVSTAQLAIAWVAAQRTASGVDIMPLIGARTRARLTEALGAQALHLTAEECEAIAAAVPAEAAAGARYPAQAMADLDSEGGN